MRATITIIQVGKMKICNNCKEEFEPKHHANNVKFCSINCRNKNTYQTYQKSWQEERRRKKALIPSKDKVQCLICGEYHTQVGSHIYYKHKITAREYREHYKLEVKKGLTPKWYKKLKGEQSLDNGTYKNLKVGKKFWFKKGSKTAGRYKRSPITIERLKGLYKLTKKYNEK